MYVISLKIFHEQISVHPRLQQLCEGEETLAAAKTTTIYLTESEVAVTFELETFATSTAVTA